MEGRREKRVFFMIKPRLVHIYGIYFSLFFSFRVHSLLLRLSAKSAGKKVKLDRYIAGWVFMYLQATHPWLCMYVQLLRGVGSPCYIMWSSNWLIDLPSFSCPVRRSGPGGGEEGFVVFWKSASSDSQACMDPK